MSNKIKFRVVDGGTKLGKELEQYYNSQLPSIIFQATTHVRNEVIQGLHAGGKTGRLYKRGNITHQASAAGEYPATDTGELARSINISFDKAGTSGFIGSSSPYAEALEFGTRNMLARPFLKPSLEKARPLIRKLLKALVKKAKP